MIFKRFDYQHPPINGMYWIEFSIPETDCDADDDGRTVGWYTGETIRSLGLVYIENTEDNGLPFMATPVDDALCSFDGELALIHAASSVPLPRLPEDCSSQIGWLEYLGECEESAQASAKWFWLAITSKAERKRYVTLARQESYDGQDVAGFESPYRTYPPIRELAPGDTITHFLPFTTPSLSIPVLISDESAQLNPNLLTPLDSVEDRLGQNQVRMLPDQFKGYEIRMVPEQSIRSEVLENDCLFCTEAKNKAEAISTDTSLTK
ncbi:hypothetical protein [Pseudomonas putida]|uniref:Uncharacterized protein n=1 Tax=Pseudomonas putida TaxID=303 RepID=A0A7V8J5P5_PSEPU|nr:hypothetical protein [Pseudomonas putida]KAF0255755.1 hypothetical protein GN299_06600 [Pseudomonas putida]